MATAIQTSGTYNTNNLTYDRNSTQASVDKPTEVSKASPCPHCGKPDWCYRIGKLTVCNRDASPAQGWEKTSKTDRNGKPYYAPFSPKKQPRPKAKTEYIYRDSEGQPLVKVTRIDDGNGKKRIFQSHWDGKNWVKGLTEEVRARITIYRYAEVMQAVAEGKPIFMVEGEEIVDWLWKMGLAATTTLGGAGKYRVYGNYKADLEGASLVLCPDRDEPGLKHMEDIFKDFPDAKWLYAPPSDFYWTHLPKNGGLDLKDWIDSGATADDILQAIEDRRVVVDALNQVLELDAERPRPAQSKYKQKLNLIRSVWGSRLRWNTLKKQVELDGQRLPLDGIKTKIADNFDIDITREDAKEIVLEIAKEHPYNPVVEYLEAVAQKYPSVDVGILDTIASRYLGTNDPLHAALIKRTLIAAVARAFQPGCKHDTICILQGEQGALKSTFWKTLASKPFFTDDITSGSEKDEILKLSQYWFLEYAEFETAYRKKEVAQLKAFLSRESDSARRPYGTDIEDFPRPSVLVGSTNKSEFLHDPTGERRYWVVIVKQKKINIVQLQSERDLIWAAAVAAYRSGEQWWLTDAEDELLKIANGQFQTTDSWEEPIANYLLNRSFVVVGDILTEVLKLELAKQDRATEMRVAEILRRLGWRKCDKQRRINGRVRRGWEPSSSVTNFQGGDEVAAGVVTEVVTPLNPDTAKILEQVSLPSQHIEQTLTKSDGECVQHHHPAKKENIVEVVTNCDTHCSENPETITSQATEPVTTTVTTSSLLQLLIEAWDNITALGELVLSVGSSELVATVANFTPYQIAHIKDAANQVWRPGLNRDADYNGERVEILEAGQSKDLTIRSCSCGGTIKVKRGNLRPWLGI